MEGIGKAIGKLVLDPTVKATKDTVEDTLHLKRNTDELEQAIRELSSKRDDLRYLIKHNTFGKELKTVKRWINEDATNILGKADTLTKEIRTNLREETLIPTWRVSMGKNVSKMLKDVRKVSVDGDFDTIFAKFTSVYDKVPLPINFVELESYIELFDLIMTEGKRVIGIYGRRRTGKTTLLSYLTHRFEGLFNYLIFISVGGKTIEKIQEEIGLKLGLQGEKIWDDADKLGKSLAIYKALRGHKFMIIFDDLEMEVELHRIGLEFLGDARRGKFIFSTTKPNLCKDMNVDEIKKIENLDIEDIYRLFQVKNGSQIPQTPSTTTVPQDQSSGGPSTSTTRIVPSISVSRMLVEFCEGDVGRILYIGRCMRGEGETSWKYVANELQKLIEKSREKRKVIHAKGEGELGEGEGQGQGQLTFHEMLNKISGSFYKKSLKIK